MKETMGSSKMGAVQHETLADSMKMHATGGHKPHAEYFKQHAAGHMVHDDHVEKMCGGGMAKKRK
jgi:hypothetical protein